MNNDTIRFPGLHISLKVPQTIEIGSFSIAFYGIMIAIAFFAGTKVVCVLAKKSNQDPEKYMDFFVYAVISAILGARLYYIIFEWSYYKNHLSEVFNIRNGGLAVYGGIIAVIAALVWFCRRKKMPFFKVLDTMIVGLPLGQAIGRWGNFFNREAFGGYSDNLFRMEIPVTRANGLTAELLLKSVDGYISVHPTFLYESLWDLLVFGILLFFYNKRKFDGENMCLYMVFYGIGRAVIESMRTDQLLIGKVPVSMVLSIIISIVGAGIIIFKKFSKNV